MNQLFTGQEHDDETQFDFFQARYLSAAQQRFLSPDPGNAGADLFNPQSWNAYAYVNNNPLNATDPTGMSFVPCELPDSIGCVGNDPEPPGDPHFIYCFFFNCGGGGNSSQQELAQIPLPPQKVQVEDPPKSGKVFTCASEAAAKVSIAGALQRFGIGTSGVGGFITNALGGNAFSGATDLIQSFGSGEAGGHNVLYNMGQGVAAGPSQGFAPTAKLAGRSLEGTPWASGPVDVVSTALAAGEMRVMTGAGGSIQTINGAVKLGTILGEGAEYGSGVGEAKLAYDFLTWAGSLAGCAGGVIR